MKAHTIDFKNEIKRFGREIDSKIMYGTTELGKEQLNSVTPHYESSLLKSVMKQLDIDSNVEIPLETVINYQFGVKVGNSYEYLNYGNYVVYKTEKQEDTRSWKITCYDKMLYAMKDYESLGITYPITIKNYLSALCTKLGLTLASNDFVNEDKEIASELYLDSQGNSLGYTYRDVLDELSQVVAGVICINEDDEVEIRYPNETNDTIDEEMLKDVNVNFGEKFGPVNSVVLSRSAESDNIYRKDDESIEENGLTEIKIKDNQILNGNNRDEFIDGIFNRLKGIEYYVNDYVSTGIAYLELLDFYKVKIDNNTYKCLMLNDELDVTQGLEEPIYAEGMEYSETDYKHASKTDRTINQAYIIAKKNNAEIQALASKVVDISNTISGIGSITLDNAYKGILHRLEISGAMNVLFPSTTLTPKTNLIPIEIYLIVDGTRYILDIDYLNYTNAEEHDTFVYEDGKCWIERINGNIEEREPITILVDKDSEISIEPFTQAHLFCEYLLDNKYTSTFANQVEVSSELNLLADTLEAKVSQVADQDGNVTSASIILAVNNDSSQATINADKVSLEGKNINLTSDNININSTNFVVDSNGNVTCNEANIKNAKLLFDEDNPGTEPFIKMSTGSHYDGEMQTNIYPGIIELNNFASDMGGIAEPQLRLYWGFTSQTTTIGAGGCYSPSFTPTSLKENKKNFEKMDESALDILKDIDIYKYHLKGQDDKEKKHIGFVIGDGFKYSEKVTSTKNDGADLYGFISVCCKAIQELQQEIEELRKEIK